MNPDRRDRTSPVRVCTFNVRYDTADDARDWDERRARVLETIDRLDPDLLGVQEALAHQYADLREGLPELEWAGVGRLDGDREGEFVPIAWRADRFEARETGAFWLSETPSEPSVGWDAALPRVATWATLRGRERGDRLWFCNAHFDHVGERARVESARLVRDRARERLESGASVVLAGDFNCEPGSPPYRELSDGPLVDARRTADQSQGPNGTFHGFDGVPTTRIDYVFVSRSTPVRRHRTLEPRSEGARSDHCPVVVDLRRSA